MQRVTHFQPNMTVDAGAAVPPGIWNGIVVDVYADKIRFAIADIRRNIAEKAGVAVNMPHDKLPVYADFRVHIHALKFQEDFLAPPLFRNLQFFFIAALPEKKRWTRQFWRLGRASAKG
jgi:hypothetical protein